MILAILQARMGSKRLPGKVLKPILGMPMLFLEIERIQKSAKIDQLIVATTISPEDDVIEVLTQERGIHCFRGEVDNVLSRYVNSALNYRPEHVVRLTADCPFLDPKIIDSVIEKHLIEKNDYTSNVVFPTFADGLDVEILSYNTLIKIDSEATAPIEREHVTYYIHKNKEKFKIGSFTQDFDHSHFRLTVDNKEDFCLVELIFNHFYPISKDFSYDDIIEWLLKNPNACKLNSHYYRNEALCQNDI